MNNYPLINGQSRFDAVIVANGSYPQNKACHTLIQHASHLIVCDGAAQSLVNDGGRGTSNDGDRRWRQSSR